MVNDKQICKLVVLSVLGLAISCIDSSLYIRLLTTISWTSYSISSNSPLLARDIITTLFVALSSFMSMGEAEGMLTVIVASSSLA
jgi:hypothetical protein